MKYKVVVTDKRFNNYDIEREVLAKVNAELVIKEEAQSLKDVAADADALLVNLSPIGKEVISDLKKCRVISRYGVGYDNVDVKACAEMNIVVSNVPDYCSDEASEHALALMLTSLRRIHLHDKGIREGKWNIKNEGEITRVRGKTFGIVGYGNIGRKFHELLKAFNPKDVLIYSPSASEEIINSSKAKKVSLETLLKESDVVSLHIPLSTDTKHMIGKEEFRLMKDDALFINTSRGGCVDEIALTAALMEGQISFAALDVFEEEPISKANKLLTLPNVLLSDHQAWRSKESILELKRLAAENIAVLLSGKAAINRVN